MLVRLPFVAKAFVNPLLWWWKDGNDLTELFLNEFKLLKIVINDSLLENGNNERVKMMPSGWYKLFEIKF